MSVFSDLSEEARDEYLSGLAGAISCLMLSGIDRFAVVVVGEEEDRPGAPGYRSVYAITDQDKPIMPKALVKAAQQLESKRSFKEIMDDIDPDPCNQTGHSEGCDCHKNAIPDHVPQKILNFMDEILDEIHPGNLAPSQVLPVAAVSLAMKKIAAQLQESVDLRKQKEREDDEKRAAEAGVREGSDGGSKGVRFSDN